MGTTAMTTMAMRMVSLGSTLLLSADMLPSLLVR